MARHAGGRRSAGWRRRGRALAPRRLAAASQRRGAGRRRDSHSLPHQRGAGRCAEGRAARRPGAGVASRLPLRCDRCTAATTAQTFRRVRGDLRDTHLSQLASERGSQNPKRNKPPSRVRARRGSSAGGLRRTRPRGASSRWAAAATRYDGGSCTGGEWGGRGVRGGWNVWGIWRQAGPHWGGHRRAGGVWSAHENVCMEICG